jgi:hypothetical protein
MPRPIPDRQLLVIRLVLALTGAALLMVGWWRWAT